MLAHPMPLAADRIQSVAHAGTADAEAAHGDPPQADVVGEEVMVTLSEAIDVDEAVEKLEVGTLELSGVEVDMLTEMIVDVTIVVHGVVGFAVTQSQRAETDVRTCSPVSIPHPATTQLRAEFWIAAVEEHWHSKSSVAQPTPTAPESMQSVAQAGTAEAEAAHGKLPQVEAAGADVMTILLEGSTLELLLVVEVVDGQSVTGLSVTHEQRAETEVRTCKPVAIP